jgi:hypothetical protein
MRFWTLAYRRGCLGGGRLGLLLCSDEIKFLSNYACPTERHTKRYAQTSKPWYEHKVSLKECIPLLDALIIPKAVRECKTILGHFAKFPMYFYLPYCITTLQVSVCVKILL